MRKILLLALLLGAIGVAPARAQLTVPYTFVNGTAANADEVNANFNKFSDALNRTGGTMTGTLTSRSVVPSATNTYDLGSTGSFFQSAYLRTSFVFGQTTANYTLTWANPASARAISIMDPGGTDVFTFNAATQTLTNKTLTAPTITSPVITGTVTGSSNLALLASTNTFTGITQKIDGATNAIWIADRNSTSDTAAFQMQTNGSTNWYIGQGVYTSGSNLTIGDNSAAILTLTSAGVLTLSGLGSHAVSGGANSGQSFAITNTTSGTAAYAYFQAAAGTTTGFLEAFSQGYTTSSSAIASSVRVYSGGTGGMSFVAGDAAGVLRFYTGGSTLRWGINAAGDFTVGTSSEIADSIGTPTVFSCTNCGTSSIAGRDYAFTVDPGSTTGNPVTAVVTFGHTWTSAPYCVASTTANTSVPVRVITSTTTANISIAENFAPTGTGEFTVLCRR